MKRILLVFPYMGDECVPLLPPLSACFLSVSAQKAGWHLDLLDGQLHRTDKLFKVLRNCVQEYDAFGISVYSGFVKPAISIARLIRCSSSAPIIWGGPHPTLFPSQLEDHDLADFVVTGYGEQPLELLLRNNFNCEHNILHGDCGPALATYCPDYEVCDIERYWVSERGRVFSIITSRGCRYSCRFCINSVQKKAAVFMEEHSIEVTISDLALRYGIDTLHVWDEHFYKNDERVMWFCDLMRKYNLSWQANIRADIVGKLSDDVMSALARCGCYRINMGLESASDRVLKILGKGIRVSDYLAAVDRCMTYGVPISASPIYSPGNNVRRVLNQRCA